MFENDSGAEREDIVAKITRGADDFFQLLEATECDAASISIDFITQIGDMTATVKLEMKAVQSAPF